MIFERTIDADVQTVWSVMTDVQRYAERFSGADTVELLAGGSFGVGTRWREIRTVYGRQASLDIGVVEVEINRRYVTEAHVGARATTEFVFTPVGDGGRTSVRVTFRTTGGALLIALSSCWRRAESASV